MLRVGIYLRISEQDALEGESCSIGNQRAVIRQYLEKRQEFCGCLVTEFIDDGITGTSTARPGLEELKRAIENKEIDCIVVKDLSRLGRNYLDVGELVDEYFPTRRVRFISIGEYYDSKYVRTFCTDVNLAFQNIANDMYSRNLSVQVKTAKYNRARNGQMGISVCYGYLKDPENKYGYLLDEAASKVVLDIFKMTVYNDMTLAQIAEELNHKAIAPPGKHKHNIGLEQYKWKYPVEDTQWTTGMVYRILRNERYTGLGVFGETERLVPGRGDTAIKNAREKWVRVEDHHPAIVTKELFDIARESLKERSPIKEKPQSKSSRIVMNTKICHQPMDLVPMNTRDTHEKRLLDERYHLQLQKVECYQEFKKKKISFEEFERIKKDISNRMQVCHQELLGIGKQKK